MNNQVAKQFVKYAISIGALEFVMEGRRLKSGRISPYFFNSGLFNTGESIFNLAKAYVAAIKGNFFPEVVFGPAYKGIPIAVAVAQVMGGNIGYAFNRKEIKNHGEGGIIVGSSLKGKKVLIVDDVMTTGTSSGEAVEIVNINGGIPIGCVIAFDRQECAENSNKSAVQEFEENYGIVVCAAATLSDLIDLLKKKKGYGRESILEKIIDYKIQYVI